MYNIMWHEFQAFEN